MARPWMLSDGWITRPRVRAYAAMLAMANVACALAWVLSLRRGIDPWGNGLGSDFLTFYAAGSLALHGHAAGAYEATRLVAAERVALPAGTGVLRWFYPPSFLVLVTPLALLPYAGAVAAWLGAQAAVYAALVRRLSADPVAPLLALAFPAVLICGLQGQNGFLSAGLLGLGLLLSERRPLAAGALLGLLAYKPHLAIIAPLVLAAAGRWRVLAAMAASAAAVAALSLAAFGPAPWLAFPQAARDASAGLAAGALPWAEVPSVFVALRSLGWPPPAAMLGHLAVAAPVATATALAWRRGGPLALRAGLAGAAALVLSPYVFTYDLVVLVLPLGAAAEHLKREGGPPGARTAVAALFAAPLMIPVAASLAHVQLGAAATLAAWVLCLRLLRAPAGVSAPSPARPALAG